MMVYGMLSGTLEGLIKLWGDYTYDYALAYGFSAGLSLRTWDADWHPNVLLGQRGASPLHTVNQIPCGWDHGVGGSRPRRTRPPHRKFPFFFMR